MKFTKETHEFRDVKGVEILDILDYSDEGLGVMVVYVSDNCLMCRLVSNDGKCKCDVKCTPICEYDLVRRMDKPKFLRFTKETHEFRCMKGVRILDILNYTDRGLRHERVAVTYVADGELQSKEVNKDGMYSGWGVSDFDLVLKRGDK